MYGNLRSAFATILANRSFGLGAKPHSSATLAFNRSRIAMNSVASISIISVTRAVVWTLVPIRSAMMARTPLSGMRSVTSAAGSWNARRTGSWTGASSL